MVKTRKLVLKDHLASVTSQFYTPRSCTTGTVHLNPKAPGLPVIVNTYISNKTLGFDQMAFSLAETVAVDGGSQNCDITAAAMC